ncbi:MAG: Re/Si-specific NAD(P)(+) transhydrogenase subunit alpha [archaeon]
MTSNQRSLKFGIPRETQEGERRVAVTPDMVKDLVKLDAEVLVEKDAGAGSYLTDSQYTGAGAEIVDDSKTLYEKTNTILRVQPPTATEIELMRNETTLVGLFWAITDKKLVNQLAEKKMTVFSLELVPRIARAQSMDVLTSMSSISGYKAVLLAAERFNRFFPLMMTAAGTISPCNLLVIGAGVAGLQAIATAKRLGARVEAFDTRPSVKEQVESLGARFVEMELPKDTETEGGYAKEMSNEFIKKELEAIGSRLPRTDIIITTAQVFGKRAPVLITEAMVKTMPRGSVIVDIAVEQGGNCELAQAGKTVEEHGVTIIGPVNLPSTLPMSASQMYSRNMMNFVNHVYQGDDRKPDLSDNIVGSCCVLAKGELVSSIVKKAFSEVDSK